MKPFLGIGETARKQIAVNARFVRRNQRRQGAQMNHSIHSADRATHLKIVMVALVAGMAVAGFGISARTNSDYAQSARIMKAGEAVTVTSSDTSLVR
jgi:hypothetical protein